MKLKKLNISADGYNLSYLAKLSEITDIYRIHIGCIEDNYKAIEKSIGVENAVVHILINRIDSIERLKQQLIDFKVQRILLLTGNPHPNPYKHSFTEIIKQLKDIVDVYVAAYPTSVFYIQRKQHISFQVTILKEKIEAGAKEVYLQSTYNMRKLLKFQQALQEEMIIVPIHYGISPNITIKQTFSIIKEVMQSFHIFFNLRNLDFILRLLKTSNKKAISFFIKFKNTPIFRDMDGFHLTTLDSSLSNLFELLINNQIRLK